jgi:hypothetical protein
MNGLAESLLILAMSACMVHAAAPLPLSSPPAQTGNDEFVQRKPGEITFTTGIVIEGRVEKPQVMLVLTKERIKLSPVVFSHSFLGDLTAPAKCQTFEIFTESEKDRGKAEIPK